MENKSNIIFAMCNESMLVNYRHGILNQSQSLDQYSNLVSIIKIDHIALEDYYEKNQIRMDGERAWAAWIKKFVLPITTFDFEVAAKMGLFRWIEEVLGATTTQNVCAAIGGICEAKEVTAIELFDEINRLQGINSLTK